MRSILLATRAICYLAYAKAGINEKLMFYLLKVFFSQKEGIIYKSLGGNLDIMLFDVVDSLQKKRRLLYVVLFITIDFWLLALCNQTLQAHRSNITSRIHNYEATTKQVSYQGDIFNGDSMFENIGAALNGVEVAALRATVSATDGITKAEHALQTAASSTLHSLATASIAVVRFVVLVISTIIRVIFAVIVGIMRAIVWTLALAFKIVTFPFIAAGHGVNHLFSKVSGLKNSNLASVIQPQNGVGDVPVITPEQAQQATLIQENTVAVKPVKPTGSGGACDAGAGNGGYPMDWCDARMDSISTVSYSSDRINRECTSYAYWYFTTVEGHADFHATGNANRWARTSNYPAHVSPAVGAIAVETGGYYGHVAIVQALAGQTYDGQTVPDGYVLVSEMNYDWQGHFRYSYSPLNKFSAYIYP